MGTTDFVGAPQIASYHNGYSVHTSWSLPTAGALGWFGAVSHLVAHTQLDPCLLGS